MLSRRQKYDDYLNSAAWREIRYGMLILNQYACQWCGAHQDHVTLQVHHKHYERFGREWFVDLELLCIICHKKADDKRRAGLYVLERDNFEEECAKEQTIRFRLGLTQLSMDDIKNQKEQIKMYEIWYANGGWNTEENYAADR